MSLFFNDKVIIKIDLNNSVFLFYTEVGVGRVVWLLKAGGVETYDFEA